MTSSVKPGSWHISPLDLSDRLHPSTDPSLQWTALVGRAAEFSYRCFVFFSADHFWVLKALVRVGRHVAQTQCVFPSAETCSTFIQHPHQQAVLNSSAGFPPFMLKLHVWQSPRLLRCGKKVGNILCTLAPCSSAPLEAVGPARAAEVCSWHPPGWVEADWKALEKNSVTSFNSGHEKKPRGPVRWWFGFATGQFASFYRWAIQNGSPRGNLKCGKFYWYCCGPAQSHLHLTPYCSYNHITAVGMCLQWTCRTAKEVMKLQSILHVIVTPILPEHVNKVL